MNLFLNSSSELRTGFRALAFYLLSLIVLAGIQMGVRLFGMNDGRSYQAIVYPIEAVGILGVSVFSFRLFEHCNSQPLGLRNRKTGVFILQGVMAGLVALGVVFVGVRLQMGWPGALRFHVEALGSRVFWLAVVTYLFSAAVEELLFRGYPFLALRQSLGRWGATMGLSLLFVGVHPNLFQSTAAIVSIFLGGVFFTQLFVLSGSLWLPIAFHFGWNLSQDLIFPLPGQRVTVVALPNFDPASVGLTVGAEQSWWAAAELFVLVVIFEAVLSRRLKNVGPSGPEK